MASETILTAFRTISGLTTAQFADADVTDKAEPFALDYYEKVMGVDYTITDHSTGEGTMIDKIFAILCAVYAYQNKYPRDMKTNRGMSHWDLEQVALSLMQKIEPRKIGHSARTNSYYVIGKNRGNALYTASTGE